MIYAALGFTVPIFDPLFPYFSTTFNIGFDKIGLVFFGGSFIAIVTNIIAGHICDRYPYRRVMLFSFLITFTGFCIFSIYQSFLSLIATVFIVNIGFNFVWPGSYSAIFNDFNENFSVIYIRLDKFYYFATLFGPLIISFLFYIGLDLRILFVFLAAIFGTLFILFYFSFGKQEKLKYLKNNKIITNSGKGPDDIKKNERGLACANTGFKKIFKKATVLSSLALMLFACVMTGSSAWLTTYFSSFDVPIFLSSVFVSVYWFFTFIGLQFVSRLLKHLSEAKILFYGGLLSSAGLVFYGTIPNIYIKIVFLVLVAMGVAGIYPLAAAIAVRENPEASASASGFTVAMGIAGGLIIQPLMGFVAEYINKKNVPFVLLIISLLGTLTAFLLLKHLKEPILKKSKII